MFTLCTLISSFYFYRMMCYFIPYIFLPGELERVIKPYSLSSKSALLIEKISNFISRWCSKDPKEEKRSCFLILVALLVSSVTVHRTTAHGRHPWAASMVPLGSFVVCSMDIISSLGFSSVTQECDFPVCSTAVASLFQQLSPHHRESIFRMSHNRVL